MPDPLIHNNSYRVRREVQEHNLQLRLESREIDRIRRGQRRRDRIAWVAFVVMVGLIILADFIAR
ncbi:MAG: hypothetical protein JW990_19355 [Thermoleophilia bacterium]|nr:hypothetical protein [Thermoleophilia bacterium]